MFFTKKIIMIEASFFVVMASFSYFSLSLLSDSRSSASIPVVHIILSNKTNASRWLTWKWGISSIIDSSSSLSSESSPTTFMGPCRYSSIQATLDASLQSTCSESMAVAAEYVSASNSIYSSVVRPLSIWLVSSLNRSENSSSSSSSLISVNYSLIQHFAK